MGRRRRRAFYYLGALVAFIAIYVVAYRVGMAVFEGESRSFADALLVVVQSITTTGYGEDAAFWNSWPMVALITMMNFTGVFFIFMALPLFAVPWLEAQLSTTIPDAVDLTDHVIIASADEPNATLLDELTVRDVPYVLLESDRERARSLLDDGETVIHGDPTNADSLERASLASARSLVADIDDETNASVALAASEGGADAHVITFVEDPDLTEYHEYAGADTVYSPRHLVGESLARKVTSGLDAELADAIEIAEDFEIAELPVQAGSDLAGTRVAESGIRERTGANIVGAWFRGEFVSPPDPDAFIDPRTILLVAGRDHQLEALKELTLTEARKHRTGDVIVCGYGEVGSTVKRTLTAAGIDCLAIDQRDVAGVDVVGDVTDREPFEEADVTEASTVILALPDDTTTVFATLVIRQLTESVEVVARANAPDSVRKLHQAGADYVLALSTVSGRMLASTILGEDVISFGQQVDVERLPAGALAGKTLEGTDLRARTGCTVVAVERDGAVLTELPPDFRLETGDEIVVAGPDDGVAELRTLVTD